MFLSHDELLRRLRRTDVLLASFPRSGNTWLRFILADLLVDGYKPYPTSIVELNRIIYAVYKGMGEARFLPTRLVKTHEPHPGTSHRFVVIVRRPTDAIVSYYHFHLLNEHLHDRARAGADQFAQRMAPTWADNVWSYVAALRDGRSGILVTYEDLHAEPGSVVAAVCDFVGLDVSPEQIESAVQRRAFPRLQEMEARGPIRPGQVPAPVATERFFRKGIVGSGDAELTEETLRLVAEVAQPVYEAAMAVALPAGLREGQPS